MKLKLYLYEFKYRDVKLQGFDACNSSAAGAEQNRVTTFLVQSFRVQPTARSANSERTDLIASSASQPTLSIYEWCRADLIDYFFNVDLCSFDVVNNIMATLLLELHN